jgi:hypothetical protein
MSNDDYLSLDQLNDRIAILEDNIRQLIEYEAMGLTPRGQGARAIKEGWTQRTASCRSIRPAA